jgi:multiple sugar transport system substrate-binding protein
VPTPPVPESELIVNLVAEASERAARNRQTIDQALASLDAEVDGILEKRRWLMTQRLLSTDPAGRPR